MERGGGRRFYRQVARRVEKVFGDREDLGLVLVQAGELAEAERALRRALLLDPSLVKAAAQLGHLLFQSGRYTEAAHFYRGCVEMGRDDLRGHLQQALTRARASATSPTHPEAPP